MFKSLSKFIPKNKLNLKDVVQNKWLLYILCFIALLCIIFCACKKDYNSLFTFLLIGFIMSFFIKNMTIILGVSIALTYILKHKFISRYMEGMEDKGTEDEETKDEETKDEDAAVFKENLEEFEGIQKRIIEGLEKMEPLIKRAETFVEKFDKDSKNLEKIKTKK